MHILDVSLSPHLIQMTGSLTDLCRPGRQADGDLFILTCVACFQLLITIVIQIWLVLSKMRPSD